MSHPFTDTCKHGHPWTPETTYIQPNDQYRRCRICRATTWQSYQRTYLRAKPPLWTEPLIPNPPQRGSILLWRVLRLYQVLRIGGLRREKKEAA